MTAIGHRIWAIAEGYIPSQSVSEERTLLSHETACILNATDRDAHVAHGTPAIPDGYFTEPASSPWTK